MMKTNAFEEAYRLGLVKLEKEMTLQLAHVLDIYTALQEKSCFTTLFSGELDDELSVYRKNYYALLSQKAALLLIGLTIESTLNQLKHSFAHQVQAYANAYHYPYCRKPRFYKLARWIRYLTHCHKNAQRLAVKKTSRQSRAFKKPTLEEHLLTKPLDINECVTKVYVYLTDFICLITHNRYLQQKRWDPTWLAEQVNPKLF